jgi:iron(III) transport system ATP-binding protein
MARPSPVADRPIDANGSEVTGLGVSNLHKSFGAQAVLTGIDLRVPTGSITAVLGPSGSGKTTLLRVVAGFERADRGTVTLGRRIVEDAHHAFPPEKRGIGYVPQEGSLFPHLSVAANIAFGTGRSNRRKSAEHTEEMLDLVGLAGQGKRYPHQLSGGEQQRVALARALAISPALVLLDEPFSSLDAGLRASVRSDVQDVLQRGNVTAVLVTHDQDEALSMADQVAVIRDGTIAQCGTPQELYDHPVDPAMARFLGDANLVPATLEGGKVVTPFGPLDIRTDPSSTTPTGTVVALIRPEQLAISPVLTGSGLRATIARTEFHGHDTVITVDPLSAAFEDSITVRAEGDLVLANGTEVEIHAGGSALVWPTHPD